MNPLEVEPNRQQPVGGSRKPAGDSQHTRVDMQEVEANRQQAGAGSQQTKGNKAWNGRVVVVCVCV